jgi:hypothetical protein
MLCTLLLTEIIGNENLFDQVFFGIQNNWLIVARFICCLILHQQLNGEILQG